MILVTKTTPIRMRVHGLLFYLLTTSTYVCSALIPNMSLVMSTHNKNLAVFSGLEDWVKNGVINTSAFINVGSGQLHNTKGISFIHRKTREMFIFSDADITTIGVINVTNPVHQAVVFHIGTSSGVGELAVDWVSGNCYWVDTVYGWIVMQAIPKDLSRINSLNPNFKNVIDTYLDIPTGIAVYPELGYLFWTDTGKIPKIERSSLTGKDRKLLAWQGVIRPTSLCIDYTNNRLYWTDPGRGTVEYSDLHGNGRGILVSSPGSLFYGIDIFQDKLVVSDLSNGSVSGSIKLFSMADGKQAGPNITREGALVFSLVVFDNRRQPLDSSQRCDTLGCLQLCIERPNSTGADCACEDGFTLNLDGKTCEAETQVLERKIVYTDTNKICSVSINAITSHRYLPPKVDCTVVNSTNNITRFTTDTHTRTFYFTDGRKIYHQRAFSIIGSQQIYSTSRNIMDLAYDWITGAVYWFEWDANGGVCYKKTSPASTQQEITSTITKPITMTFDPYNQRLFWMGLDNVNAVRLYTTGSDGKTVGITSPIIKTPTDLEYDWSTDRLFWTDDDYIGLMNSDGTNERTVGLNTTRKYHCLTVFKNYTIIGYSVPNHPTASAFTVVQEGETLTQIHFQLPNMGRVDDVKVYADSQQLIKIEPCEKNNGECQQICLPGMRTTCGCYVGYTLNKDGKTCSTVTMVKGFVIAIDSIDHKAYQINIDDNIINALSMLKGSVPSSIDYDPTNQRIVWIDQYEKRIQYFQLSGTEVRAEKKDDITQYSHVAVDVSTGNFYVTLNKKIAVIDPEFDVKTLITTSLTPGKLKVFPRIGQMVWVEGSKIRKAKMDGTEPNDFVTEGISTPSDIAFDYEGEALYWCDRILDKIVRTELMQSGTRIIISGTGEQPNNIEVVGQYLYYTSYIYSRAIYRRYKTNGTDFKRVFESPLVGGLAFLLIYKVPQTALHEECSISNGRCCKFCLPLRNGKKCACMHDSSLNDDGRTCHLDSFTLNWHAEKYSVHARVRHRLDAQARFKQKECALSIPNAELERNCLPCYNRHCSFTCNHGFQLAVSGATLKCGSLGRWNVSSEVCKEEEQGGTSYTIIAAAAGGGGFLLVVIVIILAALYLRRKRSRPEPPGINRLRSPMPPPRVDEFKKQEIEIYDYINDSTLLYEGTNGQTPPYMELSELPREYVKLSENNPYKQNIVRGRRPSEIVHDDYLTPSIAGSLKQGHNDIAVSFSEEDNHGYLTSSSVDFQRYGSSSNFQETTRYQPWDMLGQQARGHQGPRATNPGKQYPDATKY